MVAAKDYVQRVHTERYLALLEATCVSNEEFEPNRDRFLELALTSRRPGFDLEGTLTVEDVYINPSSYNAALEAAGSCVALCREICSGFDFWY